MRIGMFSECFPPVQNGISVSVSTLVDELRGLRNRVFVVVPHHPDQPVDSPFVIRVPSLLTPFNPYPLAVPIPPQLRRRLGRIPPHVLHTHNPFVLGILGLRLAQQENLPLVSTYHTLYSHYGHYVPLLPNRAVDNLLEWWLPDYYNRCRCVIAPSRVAEASLRAYKVETPIEVIPTGVPMPPPHEVTDDARARARERFGIPACARLLLYVGRVAPEKNLELVLDAFGTLAEEFPDARLLVAGAGPHLDACRKHAEELPGAERIVFAGAVPHEELAPVYAAADLFVFGSVTETQGLVVAEARAAGTPCVVVREGGACETVAQGEDGVVVDAAVQAFAAAVRDLLGDPVRLAGMREACLRRAPGFTPAAMAARVLDVYSNAIDDHARRASAA